MSASGPPDDELLPPYDPGLPTTSSPSPSPPPRPPAPPPRPASTPRPAATGRPARRGPPPAALAHARIPTLAPVVPSSVPPTATASPYAATTTTSSSIAATTTSSRPSSAQTPRPPPRVNHHPPQKNQQQQQVPGKASTSNPTTTTNVASTALQQQQYHQYQQQHPNLYTTQGRPPPTWAPQNVPQWQPPPAQYLQQTQQYLASCTGRRRAVVIGINYFGSRNQLRGCVNDAYAMRNFLTTFGFGTDRDSMLCLTDNERDWALRPTRANIIQALLWLVRGAKAGDSLFLHYSGHGVQVDDLDGDESDGYDEAICPEDFKQAGTIVDDELNNILVRPLAPGVRLTSVFDCCHSGSILDLPYTYYSDGRIKEHTSMSRLGQYAKQSLTDGLYGGVLGMGISLVSNSSRLFKEGPSLETRIATKGNQNADVILFSGCKDTQTSADTRFSGVNAGAMTYAFTQALYQYRTPSYGLLLDRIRAILQAQYSQKPQLSTSRLIDMNQVFRM